MSKWRAALVALAFLGALELMIGSLRGERYLETLATLLAAIAIAAWAAGHWSPFHIEWGPYQVLTALALGLGLISVVKDIPVPDTERRAAQRQLIDPATNDHGQRSTRHPPALAASAPVAAMPGDARLT